MVYHVQETICVMILSYLFVHQVYVHVQHGNIGMYLIHYAQTYKQFIHHVLKITNVIIELYCLVLMKHVIVIIATSGTILIVILD